MNKMKFFSKFFIFIIAIALLADNAKAAEKVASLLQKITFSIKKITPQALTHISLHSINNPKVQSKFLPVECITM